MFLCKLEEFGTIYIHTGTYTDTGVGIGVVW